MTGFRRAASDLSSSRIQRTPSGSRPLTGSSSTTVCGWPSSAAATPEALAHAELEAAGRVPATSPSPASSNSFRAAYAPGMGTRAARTVRTRGYRAGAIRPAAAWHGSAAQDNGQVIEVDPGGFEEMVGAALDGLPEELGRLMRNVAVTVEHGAGPPGLLGLYEGIPLTSRTSQYAGVLPDRITIYRQAICAICRTEKEVADQVRRTVIHEIAHHFGIGDERLSELGW